jgi:hypothetical protein
MERRRWLVDPRAEQLAEESRRPLSQHLDDFRAKMQADGRDERQIRDALRYIRAVTAGCQRTADISADLVNAVCSTTVSPSAVGPHGSSLFDRREGLYTMACHQQEAAFREGLGRLVATKAPGARVFGLPTKRRLVAMLLAMIGAHPNAVKAVMRHSTTTLTMDTYEPLLPGREAETIARLPDMLGRLPDPLRATGTTDTAESFGEHLGEQSNGQSCPRVARRGETEGEVGSPDTADDLTPQVLPLSRKKSRRRVVATAGVSSFEAEGKGLEPSTGKPAPDFESGC